MSMATDDARQCYQEASRLHAEGRHTEALEILNALLQDHPDSPQLLKAKAKCLEALQKSSPTTTKPKKPFPLVLPVASAVLLLLAVGGYVLFHPNAAQEFPNTTDALSPKSAVTMAAPEQVPREYQERTDYNNSSSDNPHPRIIFPDPVTYIDQPFNLEREVARVMLDPRFPDVKNPNWVHYKKWNREFYQDIIDAAREKRLSHGNPYLGEKVDLPATDTITVPGNITGKVTLRIRYMCNTLPPAPPITQTRLAALLSISEKNLPSVNLRSVV